MHLTRWLRGATFVRRPAFSALVFVVILTTFIITWPAIERPRWAFRIKLVRQTYLPLMWPPLHHGLWRYYMKQKYAWIPQPISPSALAESRREVLSRSPPSPYPFDASRPPGVALLFLCLDGIDHASLWQRWIEDGRKYLRQKIQAGLNPDDYLSVHVHHPEWVDRKLVLEGTPESFHKGILAKSAECFWGNLNPCVVRLLDGAFQDQKAAEWFVMVSADSIPLKSFAKMYEELLRDRRTRMTFLDLYFQHGIPRVCNWFVLSRAHTELLLRRQDEWLDGSFVFVTNWLQGAADEFDFFWPLLDEYGEALFKDINPGLQMTDPDVKWQQMSTPMYNCWRSTVCLQVGEMEVASEPARYLSLDEQNLTPLLEDPQIFFMRKVRRNAVVYLTHRHDRSAHLMLTLDYLTTKLGLNSTSLHPPPMRPPVVMPASYKIAGIRHVSNSTAPAYGRLRRGKTSQV